MLAFLVLIGHDGAPIDDDLMHRLPDDHPALPFEPEDRLVWTNRERSVVFLGWQAFTTFAGIGSHWSFDADRLTAFSGHCWPQETGWDHRSGESWANQLQAWLRDRALLDARMQLFGQFDLISLAGSGPGVMASDFLNAEPLYIDEGTGFTAISNRAALCAHAVVATGSEPARSPIGAGWMICHGSMLDVETGYWDVRHVPFGSHIVIDPKRGATVHEPARSPLMPDDHASYPDVLDEVDAHLRTTLRVIAGLPVPDLEFQLSGGKDSRLLLALIVDEGLRDRFSYVTYGPPDKSDPLVARKLAEHYNLNWRLEDFRDRSPSEEELEIRRHTSMIDGMVSAWDSAGPPIFEPGAMISGLAGEYLRFGRRGFEGTQVTSAAEAQAYLRSRTGLDPLKVLRPDVMAYYAQILDDWSAAHLEHGEDVNRLGSLFLAETLVRGRFGPARSFRGRMALSPYVSAPVVQANHRLPPDELNRLRLQLDLMRRCDIPLSKLPLADKTWDGSALTHLADGYDYLGVTPARSSSRLANNYRLANYHAYRPMLERYLLDRDNPIHELVRFDRLADRIAKGDDNAGRTRRLWGVLTAAVWLGRHEVPVQIRRS